MGDYFDMYSDETGAHLAWAATFNGEQDVYYSVIKPDYANVNEAGNPAEKLSVSYPNPFRDRTAIRYQVAEKTTVRLSVFNSSGMEVAVLVDEIQDRGVYREVFDASGLQSGVYYYRLQAGNRLETGRMTLVR
jgi:hypothetical protein